MNKLELETSNNLPDLPRALTVDLPISKMEQFVGCISCFSCDKYPEKGNL